MALQCEGPSRVLRRRQVASWSSIFSAMVLLLVVLASAEEFASRKHLEPEKKWGEGQLKNLDTDHGEDTWKVLISQVVRLSGISEEREWPELKLDGRTVTAIILGVLAAAVSASAGVGGGLLFVPLLKLLLQFDSRTATAMSNFMMLGLSTMGVAINIMRDHPTGLNQPLLDFDIALLLQPNMLLGISIGVLFNSVLPNWLITALLMVILVYMTYQMTRSGVKRWNDETRLADAKRSRKKTLQRSTTETEKALTEYLLDFYKSLSRRYPIKTILVLLFVWLAFFAVQLLRGGHGRQGLLGVPECGVGYWLLTASQIPITLGVTGWVIYNLPDARSAGPGPSTSDNQDQQSYELGRKDSFYFAGVAVVAGVLAGMLGIGGSIIINPLLLSVGVLPQVATATSLFMVFLSSSMASFEYWLMGTVPVGYALIAALICAPSSGVGIVGLQKIVKKYGRPSLIVFTIAAVIGFCTIVMGIFGTRDVWNQYESGADMGFHYPC